MSEPNLPTPPPTPESPSPGRPYSGQPRALPGGGCGRPLLIGCGVVAVLLGVAGIIFVAKAKDLLAWTMKQLQTEVVAALPADVTADERARLDRGFDAAMQKIRDGQVEPPALFALQRQLSHAAEVSQQRKLTRDDVLDLLSALERVGGLLEPSGEAPAEPEAPPATPSPGVQPQAGPST